MKSEHPVPDPAWGFLVLAALLVLALAGWFVYERMPHGDDPGMQQLMDRLDAMDRTNGRLRASDDPTPGTGGDATNAASAQAEPDERSRLDALETGFSQEPEDPAAAEIETRLRAIAGGGKLAAAGIVAEGVDVKCRSKTCRIVANFRNADDASDWSALYAAFMGTTLVSGCRTMFVRDAEGGMQARMFASRSQPADR